MFVHFPIALLMTYAALEIVPLGRWFPRAPWESIKTFLVVSGTLGAGAAIATGLIAKNLFTGPLLRKIISLHETFAYAIAIIFGIPALAYLIRLMFREYSRFAEKFPALSFLQKISDVLLNRWVAVPLALIGAAAITITGALGGIIVYGPDIDPVAKFVYSLFF